MPVNPAATDWSMWRRPTLPATCPGNEIGPAGFYCGVTPLPAFHPLRGCCRAKCGILPTRSLALCAVHFLVTGRRIFDSIQGAHAALLFSLPGRIIDIRG